MVKKEYDRIAVLGSGEALHKDLLNKNSEIARFQY